MSMIIDFIFFCFKQKTAYEMRISDWSSDVCSSDLQFLARETLYIFADLELACDRECRAKMVAGNHLHRNTSGAAFGDRSLGLFTWRIDEAHQAEKHDAIAEIIERDACLGRGQPSHCKTQQALAMISRLCDALFPKPSLNSGDRHPLPGGPLEK